MKPLDIAFWQGNPTVGDVGGNLARLVEYARTLPPSVDLLMTPECYGTGYPIQDLALRPGFVAGFRRALEALSARVVSGEVPPLLVGGPEEGTDLPHNAMFLLDRDGSVRVTRKHHLANSEVYDERRTFSPGGLPSPIPFRGWKLGVLICEDAWHGDVARALAQEGADVLLCPNGSHFTDAKQERRRTMGRRTVAAVGLPFVYLNLCGGQDELVFDGGSFVLDHAGRMLHETGFVEQGFVVHLTSGYDGRTSLSVTLTDGRAPHGQHEGGYPHERNERLYTALVTGLRDYVDKTGFPGVLIGMSGGIDSALTAAIAVDALGSARVTLVRMPAAWTSAQSMDDAQEASDMLGTRLLTIPIGSIVASLEEALGREVPVTGITAENLQARARGTVLMGMSNATGLMVLSTGNKSEMTVGYSTLYGDMCGGFNALKDVWKTDVFALSAWRNTVCIAGCLGPVRVMPDSIITRPPSAELAPGQEDSHSLGSYDDLDMVLRLVIEDGMGAVAAAGEASRRTGRDISEAYAEKVVALASRAEYKRRQAPPGLVVGHRDYTKGWRLPLVNKAGIRQ